MFNEYQASSKRITTQFSFHIFILIENNCVHGSSLFCALGSPFDFGQNAVNLAHSFKISELVIEPRHEKTGFLHMLKQRC